MNYSLCDAIMQNTNYWPSKKKNEKKKDYTVMEIAACLCIIYKFPAIFDEMFAIYQNEQTFSTVLCDYTHL